VRSLLSVGALVWGVIWLASGQTGPQAPPSSRLQALIITGQNAPSHDWRSTTPVLRQILEATGRFEVRVTDEFRGAGPETRTIRPGGSELLRKEAGRLAVGRARG